MKFEVGERVQVIADSQIRIGTITEGLDDLKDGQMEVDLGDIYYYAQEEDIAKLDQPEPVKVPRKIFDFIKSYDNGKDSLIVFEDILCDYINDNLPNLYIHGWVDENLFELADALRNGYVVEEEKKYYVKIVYTAGGFLNLQTERDGSFCYRLRGASEPEGYKTKFTETEIKAIDERLWTFAVPVEEVEASE